MCKNEREGTLKEGEDSVEMQSIQSMAAVTSVLGLQKHCVCGTRGEVRPPHPPWKPRFPESQSLVLSLAGVGRGPSDRGVAMRFHPLCVGSQPFSEPRVLSPPSENSQLLRCGQGGKIWKDL